MLGMAAWGSCRYAPWGGGSYMDEIEKGEGAGRWVRGGSTHEGGLSRAAARGALPLMSHPLGPLDSLPPHIYAPSMQGDRRIQVQKQRLPGRGGRVAGCVTYPAVREGMAARHRALYPPPVALWKPGAGALLH